MQTHWSHPLDAFKEESFTNQKTGVPYKLVRADAVAPSPERVEQVRAICNERPVYDTLFAHIFGGKPYTAEAAAGFLSWAAQGWRERTHFIADRGRSFLIPNLERAEPPGEPGGFVLRKR